ncbi:MAG: hypothetical protein KUG69_08100, partial [Marinosulfonomonas sp.]|nr:hypothetical protein [Marinosulfonomonas sp.]
MTQKSTVKRRRVFYIPGYDPNPPRRYRELYRKESARQAEISGYRIDVKAASDKDGYGWSVRGTVDGVSTQARVDVLEWSDLVKTSMKSGIGATYVQMFKTAWIYLSSGALRRMMMLRKGPVIAALYPVAILLLQAIAAIATGWMLGGFLSSVTYPRVGWIIALPIIILILRWFRAQDGRLYAYYLMHDYAFTASHRGANPPQLQKRLQAFSARIQKALASDVDEVLIVGHSSGAHLAINILADLLRAGKIPTKRPALAFLSLGQVVPMVSFLPKADQLRRDLHDLSTSPDITWVDVSAPGDGCSFALCDPVAVSGVATESTRWPLVISASFTQTLAPATWKALKRRYFRLHFQYLCAFDR